MNVANPVIIENSVSCKLQPLEQKSAMRPSIIPLLFTALGALACVDKVQEINIQLPIKNGIVQIAVTNNRAIVLNLTKNDGEHMVNILSTKVSRGMLEDFTLKNCGNDRVCINNGDVLQTVIHITNKSDVIYVTRSIFIPDAELIDCYEFAKDTQWFGGPQNSYQYWPVQSVYYKEQPYLPTHQMHMTLSERYWLSSRGVYLYVNEWDPLFVDQNNHKNGSLCLIAKTKAPYRYDSYTQLKYELGVFADPKLAHQHVVDTHLGKPKGRPNERMISHPIWSTWARYKTNITQEMVLSYANQTVYHKFNNSQIEIDNWETCYGSAEFDPRRFPNVSTLVQQLKSKGFRVALWIHPFINRGCEPAYSTARNNSYFVRNLDANVQMSWWHGADAAAIDFTNTNATKWWVGRLKRLQGLGIDSFKFDAGEVSWLPQVPTLYSLRYMQPGIYTQDYVRTLAANFNDSIDVRVGWQSQDLPIFVRMNKDIKWTWDNGLPTLITTLLQMNLNGYVHVLPNMIGSNNLNGTEYPSKELFIRWLQASVFMPSLQYSFTPWDYDNETIAICRNYTDLHASYTPVILRAMQEAIVNGTPVNPPIWWIDPTNPVAHKINDEYLLGESILVAPITKKGAVTRDIYLPKGPWIDLNTMTAHDGQQWLKNYSAPLNILPYFQKFTI